MIELQVVLGTRIKAQTRWEYMCTIFNVYSYSLYPISTYTYYSSKYNSKSHSCRISPFRAWFNTFTPLPFGWRSFSCVVAIHLYKYHLISIRIISVEICVDNSIIMLHALSLSLYHWTFYQCLISHTHTDLLCTATIIRCNIILWCILNVTSNPIHATVSTLVWITQINSIEISSTYSTMSD